MTTPTGSSTQKGARCPAVTNKATELAAKAGAAHPTQVNGPLGLGEERTVTKGSPDVVYPQELATRLPGKDELAWKRNTTARGRESVQAAGGVP